MNRCKFIQISAFAGGAACFGVRNQTFAVEGDRSSDNSHGLGWRRIGPDFAPTKGLCYHVLPHPRRRGELLVGARPQGLLLSTDQGETWQHTSENFPENCNIGSNHESLARAPSQPDTVYAGLEVAGVRRSDDGGRTWRDLSATLPPGRARNGVSLAVHPADPETTWLGTDGGVFKTTDGGRNWRRLQQGLPTGKTKDNTDVNQTVVMIFVDAVKPERVWLGLYASGLGEPAGVWRSEDGGESWLPSSEGLDTGEQVSGPMKYRRDWVIGFARGVSEPEVFFVTTPFAVYRSGDGARTWKKLPREMGGSALAVHPRNANHVFLATQEGRVEQSIDGGKAWTDLSVGLRLGREPGAPVYEVNWTGPDGKTQVLEGTDRRFQNQVLSFSFDPMDPATLYACAHAGLYRLNLPTR